MIRTSISVGLGAVAGLALAAVVATSPGVASPDPTPSPVPSASASVSSDVAKTLSFMREEERLARDLYAAVAAAHDDARPMANITNAEQRHFEAVGGLLATYSVADPSLGRAPGDYAYPELTALYQKTLSSGSASLAGAYAAGVSIEKADIADLTQAMAQTTDARIDAVYQNLLTASEQHLAAFEAAQSGTTAGRAAGSQGGGPRAAAARSRGQGASLAGTGQAQGQRMTSRDGNCANR